MAQQAGTRHTLFPPQQALSSSIHGMYVIRASLAFFSSASAAVSGSPSSPSSLGGALKQVPRQGSLVRMLPSTGILPRMRHGM
jgi:hypothetical protein